MPTLTEYRRRLGWSIADLARNARISNPTASKAERGEVINEKTASLICIALSKALSQQVTFTDIEGLNVAV